jgi:hypothetical protein
VKEDRESAKPSCFHTTMSSANLFAALASPAPVATPTPSFRDSSSILGSKHPCSPSSLPLKAPRVCPSLPLSIMPRMALNTQYSTSKTSSAITGSSTATTLSPTSSLQQEMMKAVLPGLISYHSSTHCLSNACVPFYPLESQSLMGRRYSSYFS